MDLGLKGRACVVTGASRGIGAATARLLCAEGADVLLVGRNEERLQTAAEAARAAGEASGAAGATVIAQGDTDAQTGRAEILALDVTDEDAGERMLAAASERFGALDILVNNAGAAKWRDLDDVPDEDWRAQYELNVMAPMRAMRAAAPGMVERGWGRIVNVCSTAGKRPSASMPEYSVAKAAELSLSRVFADRYAASGVLVNAICPGPVKSEMWMDPGGLLDQSQAMNGAESREAALAEAGAKRPIGRLAEPDEIAAAIVFLCSERASYTSGAAWSVDGGTVQVII
jgi:3-oxoacyl-[acyl-carrier protein] reductase